MNEDKLREILLIENTKLYCVLDGASVPDLPKRLFDSDLPNYCLFRGDLTPDVVHMAPYVVQLKRNREFTDWVLSEGIGKNWGVCVHCRHSISELRRHFRSLIYVHDENGNPLIFRFYDPRVLRTFFPTCNPGEIKSIFGKIETFFVESEEDESIVSYKVKDNALTEKVIDLSDKE